MASEAQPLLGQPGSADLSGFSDVAVRHGFIRKVYGILFTQLAVTTTLGAIVMKYGEPLAKSNPTAFLFVLYASLVVSLAMMCVFVCKPQLMRSSPTNYIILFLFTVAESVMVGFVCIQYTRESVLIVTGVTGFIVLCLSLFAYQTSIDFTGFGPYLFRAMLALCGMSFVFWIGSMFGLGNTPAFQAARLAYAGLGVLVFSCYIVYDTQLIVGGKHSRGMQFGIDDYCAAAIALYIDIVNLFMYMLQLFGRRR